jgi:type VI secretion system protein ImpH
MGTATGREGADLSERLFHEPHRFDFFQAVRLLERLLPEGAGHAPAGGDGPPEREAVRFRATPSLGFPASAVAQLRPLAESSPAEMVVSFLGLTGPSGALPYHYTRLLLRQIRDKDSSLRDWLDLFNHRLVSLFYRAWEKYRLPFAYERARRTEGRPDRCTQALYSLVGLGTAGLRGRQEFDDEAVLYYAGHFAHQPRSASALGDVLGDHFDMPVAVEQMQGQWLVLERDDRTLLPGRGCRKGRNNQLGMNAVLGERVWDVQSKFRLRVGPLDYAQFRRHLPNGLGLKPLCQLARTYAGPDLSFDVQLVLRATEVPACRLGGADGDVPHLGWNTWLGSTPFSCDGDDAVFALEAV